MTTTTAIIPIRGLHGGKSRLSPLLSEAERSILIASMAKHVLAVVASSRIADSILVVSRQAGLLRWLPTSGGLVSLLRQPEASPGLNAAIDVGRHRALEQGASRLLVLSGDLPLLAAADLAHLGAADTDVVVGTDRAARGTNALVLQGHSTIASFEFRFGIDSRMLHEAEAAGLRQSVACVSSPGIALDLDTPEDWAMLSEEMRGRLLNPAQHTRVPAFVTPGEETVALWVHP